MSRPMNKDEFRKEMAEAFAHVLEEKGLSWRKEWTGIGGGSPQNGITKANYRGCNAFWLRLVSMIKGYSDPRWVTMVQIIDKNEMYHPKQKWHLKAGSKATYVEYWFPYDTKEKQALTWEQYSKILKEGRKQEEFYLSTKYIAVFNANEVDGIPDLDIPQNTDIKMDEIVRKLSESMGVDIMLDGGDEAYYSPHQDKIHLPAPGSFENEYAFNSTALHELSHSTGHPSRLNRLQTGMFGTSQYAYEELVAEMCSCFMGFDLDAEALPSHIENHKAYVQSWIQSIREKPETLIKAIKEAQDAANYMDWKAGLITDKEYQKLQGLSLVVPQKTREHVR